MKREIRLIKLLLLFSALVLLCFIIPNDVYGNQNNDMINVKEKTNVDKNVWGK